MPRSKATGLEVYLSVSKTLNQQIDKLAERYPDEQEMFSSLKGRVKAELRERVAATLESELGVTVQDKEENA